MAGGSSLGNKVLMNSFFFFLEYSSIAQDQKNIMDRRHGIGGKKSNITLSINKIRFLSVLRDR